MVAGSGAAYLTYPRSGISKYGDRCVDWIRFSPITQGCDLFPQHAKRVLWIVHGVISIAPLSLMEGALASDSLSRSPASTFEEKGDGSKANED
jgi:hypothetical protein